MGLKAGQMKSVTILGASGSIGTSALAFLRQHRESFTLKAASFARSWEAAVAIYREFTPEIVAFTDETAAKAFSEAVGGKCQVASGPRASAEIAAIPTDVVLASISGSAGLPSVIAAVKAGNQVALANKEALVCGGTKLLALAERHAVEVIPVDSEHSAIFQCMKLGRRDELRRIVLTASGGPFRDWSKEQIARATPSEALKHPNWQMGPKNSLDSATLANKGLELIEACYFYDLPQDRVTTLINPSTLLHSAVSFVDGSTIGLLSYNDMKNAIGYALAYPKRVSIGMDDLDLGQVGKLEFRPVDLNRFPCLLLARQAVDAGPGATMMFNAANEVAGSLFMAGRIDFYGISDVIAEALAGDTMQFDVPLDDLVEADHAAKATATMIGERFARAA